MVVSSNTGYNGKMSLILTLPAHGGPAISAAQRVEAELRRAIVALELPPGAKLSEQEIAQKLGVSRQPVREALIGLARMKLIEVVPQRGTMVVKISAKKMMEGRFVREAIETAIVARACSGFDAKARERIDDLLLIQAQVAERGDHDSFQHYDEQFHIALTDGAGCPLAWEAVRDLKAHMDRVCQLTLGTPQTMLALVEQHRAIIAAVDAADEKAAVAAMRHHLTEILRALPRVEKENPDLFGD
jgi:DNA-binding GntR family transcriptional regulator